MTLCIYTYMPFHMCRHFTSIQWPNVTIIHGCKNESTNLQSIIAADMSARHALMVQYIRNLYQASRAQKSMHARLYYMHVCTTKRRKIVRLTLRDLLWDKAVVFLSSAIAILLTCFPTIIIQFMWLAIAMNHLSYNIIL